MRGLYLEIESIIKDQQNGTVLDRSSIAYDCEKLNPAMCFPAQSSVLGGFGTGSRTSLAILIAGVFVLAILILYFLRLQKKKKYIFPKIFFIAIGGLAGMLCVSGNVHAESEKRVQVSTSLGGITTNNESSWPGDPRYVNIFKVRFPNPTIAVTYSTKSSLADGATMKPGDFIDIWDSTTADHADSIEWFMSGACYDTPFGSWVHDPASTTDASSLGSSIDIPTPTLAQNAYDPDFPEGPPTVSYVCPDGTSYLFGSGYCFLPMNFLISFKFYVPSISSSSQFACSQQSPSHWRCMANQATQNASITINYPETFGMGRGVFLGDYDTLRTRRPTSKGGNFVATASPTSISFNYKIQNPSNPPSTPVCRNCPTELTLPEGGTVSGTFNVGGSYDPDGDLVRYEPDWDDNGVVDGSPSPSGPGDRSYYFDFSKSWTTIGPKTFRFKAVDKNGAWNEEWLSHTVNIVSAPVPGQCGGTSFCSKPTDAQACTTPYSNSTIIGSGSDTDPWIWQCYGSNITDPTLSASCTAMKTIDNVDTRTIPDVCHGNDIPDTSTSYLCINANHVTFSQTADSATWTCVGSACGASKSTTYNKIIGATGECGAAAGMNFCGKNTSDVSGQELCRPGHGPASSVDSGYSEFTWTCGGESCGGTQVKCSAPGPRCGWIETNP